MSAIPHETVRSRLENVIALARLLDRVDASPVAINADQYQALVRKLKLALAQELPHDALQAGVRPQPPAAPLYQHQHVAQSGGVAPSAARSGSRLGRELLMSAAASRGASWVAFIPCRGRSLTAGARAPGRKILGWAGGGTMRDFPTR